MNIIIDFFKKLWASLFGSKTVVTPVLPPVVNPYAPPVVVSPVVVEPTPEPHTPPIIISPVVVDGPLEVSAKHPRFSAPETEAELEANERHVVAVQGGWAVKASHTAEPLEHHATKKAAIASAKAMCKASKGELFVHSKDGKIQDRTSYGHDASKRHG